MNDFLEHIIASSFEETPVMQPRMGSIYEASPTETLQDLPQLDTDEEAPFSDTEHFASSSSAKSNSSLADESNAPSIIQQTLIIPEFFERHAPSSHPRAIEPVIEPQKDTSDTHSGNYSGAIKDENKAQKKDGTSKDNSGTIEPIILAPKNIRGEKNSESKPPRHDPDTVHDNTSSFIATHSLSHDSPAIYPAPTEVHRGNRKNEGQQGHDTLEPSKRADSTQAHQAEAENRHSFLQPDIKQTELITHELIIEKTTEVIRKAKPDTDERTVTVLKLRPSEDSPASFAPTINAIPQAEELPPQLLQPRQATDAWLPPPYSGSQQRSPTTVNVSIGRIEIRANSSQPKPSSAKSKGPVVMSLDDYLNQQKSGGSL